MAGNAKPWWRSVTIWALVFQLLGFVFLGVSRGDGVLEIIGDEAVQATLGGIVAALGSAGVLWGRLRAKHPVAVRRKAKEPVDE